MVFHGEEGRAPHLSSDPVFARSLQKDGLADRKDFAAGEVAGYSFDLRIFRRAGYHRFALFVDGCEISRDRQHKKWPVRDTGFTP